MARADARRLLVDVEVPLANFFASGPLALGDRLVFMFFDNDVLARAPFDAMTLMRLVDNLQ